MSGRVAPNFDEENAVDGKEFADEVILFHDILH